MLIVAWGSKRQALRALKTWLAKDNTVLGWKVGEEETAKFNGQVLTYINKKWDFVPDSNNYINKLLNPEYSFGIGIHGRKKLPYMGFHLKNLHYMYNPSVSTIYSNIREDFSCINDIDLEKFMYVPDFELERYEEIMSDMPHDITEIISLGLNTGRADYDQYTKIQLIRQGISEDRFMALPESIALDIVNNVHTEVNLVPFEEILFDALSQYE
jgi:hypothetical protein